jgi:hypothetical protein
MPNKEYVELAREEIVDSRYNMVELVDLAWGREANLGLHLNEEPMEGNDVNDWPTLIVKLPQTREYAQLKSKFVVEHALEFLVIDVMNMQY